MSQTRMPRPRLMLILDLPAEVAPDRAVRLAAAGDVAAVVLRAPQDVAPVTARAVTAALQARGAAVLLEGGGRLLAEAAADGVHFSGAEALALALPDLKRRGDAIAGVGDLATRHDAMTAGEAGADYVLFGRLDGADAARTEDLVAWWAELFEVPCVGVAASLDGVEALARAGADFVALPAALTAGADGEAAVAAAQARLDAAFADRDAEETRP